MIRLLACLPLLATAPALAHDTAEGACTTGEPGCYERTPLEPLDQHIGRVAPDPLEVLSVFTQGLIEGPEGLPSLTVRIDGLEGVLRARITAGGFLDDSTEGVYYFVTLVWSEAGWEIYEVQRSFTCWRGVSDAGLCL